MIINHIENNKIECCGCELCEAICPTSIIKIIHDEEGFAYPIIKYNDKCINCNKCVNFCPEIRRAIPPRHVDCFYSGYVKQIDCVKTTSSGGIATALANYIINVGGVVYGVQYTDDFMGVEYFRGTSINDIERFKTSKYVQSSKNGIWKLIIDDILKEKLILFIGLPCEVAAFNNLVGKRNKNVFTIELVCHGVTSPKVHLQFINDFILRNDVNMITHFSLRHKEKGWKPYYIKTIYDNKYNVTPFKSSPYDIAFRYFKRPSCNFCKFKIYDKKYGLQADITLGDNHGVTKESDSYNLWGSSIILVHTEKGQSLLNNIKDLLVLNVETDILVKHNLGLYKPFPPKKNRDTFVKTFVEKGLFSAVNIPSVIISEKKIIIKSKIKRHIRFVLSGIKNYVKYNKKTYKRK